MAQEDSLKLSFILAPKGFIHSGFPLIEESNYFGQLVLPYMPVVSLGDVYNTHTAVSAL